MCPARQEISPQPVHIHSTKTLSNYKKNKEVIFPLIVSMPTMIVDHFSNPARHGLNEGLDGLLGDRIPL